MIGLVVGFVGAFGLRRVALPAAGLYPLAAVGLTVLAYAAGAVAHASGFLAVYVAGVVLGNARIPHRQAVLGFADGLAWLAQIGLFVLLGLLASPAGCPAAVLPALLVGVVLVLLARPIVGGAERDLVPDRLARAGVPVLGRAARRGADRAGHDPALARACRARPSCSTWSSCWW